MKQGCDCVPPSPASLPLGHFPGRSCPGGGGDETSTGWGGYASLAGTHVPPQSIIQGRGCWGQVLPQPARCVSESVPRVCLVLDSIVWMDTLGRIPTLLL